MLHLPLIECILESNQFLNEFRLKSLSIPFSLSILIEIERLENNENLIGEVKEHSVFKSASRKKTTKFEIIDMNDTFRMILDFCHPNYTMQ